MKAGWIWIVLPFLAAAGPAGADGMEPVPVAGQAEVRPLVPAGQAKQKVKKRRHKGMRLPTGDLRHCLALSGNEEIIRCAETESRP